jgi:hypothetical protein
LFDLSSGEGLERELRLARVFSIFGLSLRAAKPTTLLVAQNKPFNRNDRKRITGCLKIKDARAPAGLDLYFRALLGQWRALRTEIY